MTAKKRRRHTAEFQANAVRKLNHPGQSAQELADELEVRPSDARYTRLSNAGKALGVFAVVGVFAGVLALALPPRASRRVHARPTGTGVRFTF